jgi:gas vesicle protein
MNASRILSFVLGLLSGAIAGAGAVLLLAPQSGPRTRQIISDKVQQIVDSGKEAMVQKREELEAEYQQRIRIPLPAVKNETS